MEDASKALLIAGGVLIGEVILSLAIFIFIDDGIANGTLSIVSGVNSGD